MLRSLILITLVVTPAIGVHAQLPDRAADAVLNLLVWGASATSSIDATAYPAALRAEIEIHLRRADSYESTRPTPAPAGLEQLVHAAQVSYERRLAAASDDPAAPSLAAAYVDTLRPCYEWEGYHDCPEREARFADDYLSSNPQSPFSAYLPLLAAHRWLCTAAAYEYEKRPDDAARSRRTYEQRVSTARASTVLLIRTAADRLAARGRCRAER